VRLGAPAYERSLDMLAPCQRNLRPATCRLKSGLMLGLGEIRDEVLQGDCAILRAHRVDILTLGQYFTALPRSIWPRCPPIFRPPNSTSTKRAGRRDGLCAYRKPAPLVRSSYHADDSQRGRRAAPGSHENSAAIMRSIIMKLSGQTMSSTPTSARSRKAAPWPPC